MTALVIVLILLSSVSSLVVLLGVAIGTLRSRSRRRAGKSSLTRRGAGLDGWQQKQLQFALCLLDTVLLLAVTPLLVVHVHHEDDREHSSVWEAAFRSPVTTLATTAVLVIRPALFFVLVAGCCLKSPSTRRRWRIVLPASALALVAGVSTTAAFVGCPSHRRDAPICAHASWIKITITVAQLVFALLATLLLILIGRTSSKAIANTASTLSPRRRSIVATRAPSLSLLIPTQPDPWTRRIDLTFPTQPTDFGPPSQNVDVDYGPSMVQGILGDTLASNRTTDPATTSLGYASAVASSTNPYHVGSNFSSRDALNHVASSAAAAAASAATSRLDLPPGSGGTISTSKSFVPEENLSLRTASPAFLDEAIRPHSSLSRSATHDLLLDRSRGDDGSFCDANESRRESCWRRVAAGWVATLWCPIALSTTALMVDGPKRQTFVLLASFCFPAAVLLVQELALGGSKSLRHDRDSPHRDTATPPNHLAERDPASRRASICSSAVIVYETNTTLRPRRPHLRSHSFPLESELNGYDHSLVGAARHGSKHRQSLSSAKSVPYLSKHWTAAKVSGDRVVAPRSSLVRGLNLMLNPKPKLEILPARSVDHHLVHDRVSKDAREREDRGSMLPVEVSTAIVQGLLEVPHVQGQLTSDSERTCFTPRSPLTVAHAASASVPSLHMPEARDKRDRLSASNADEQFADIVLDMDETPGSPRLLRHLEPLHEHGDLESPTKRQLSRSVDLHTTSIRLDPPIATSPGFSEDTQTMGSTSASRLFSEIMDMVRGRPSRQSEGASSSGQSTRRTPPKGYASIQGNPAAESNTADCGGETMIVRSNDDSRSEFDTAVSCHHSTPSVSSQRQAGCRDRAGNEGDVSICMTASDVDLARKNSTSSTLSLSSISSRILNLRRGTSNGSPSASTHSPPMKKMRSRTFASAFGIELRMLRRKEADDGSSPSTTSAATYPSSLLDVSFSPSPVASQRMVRTAGGLEPSPDRVVGGNVAGEAAGEAIRAAHRRDLSRADSILDMLDDEHGDTIEELDCAVDDDDVTFACRTHAVVDDTGEEAVHDGQLEQVDLAEMTVYDAWDRSRFSSHNQEEEDEQEHDALLDQPEHVENANGDIVDLMGFDTRRVVARAPFLDTVVEEEAEDERSPEVFKAPSRESLLQDKEAQQARVSKMLLEHEIMFPHKTLSQIDEVTELATTTTTTTTTTTATNTLGSCRHRTNSAASGSRASGGGRERLVSISTTADAEPIHLGLPRSLSCKRDLESTTTLVEADDTAAAAGPTASSAHAVESNHHLAFVTPRSTVRRRAAAQHRAQFQRDQPPSFFPTLSSPSPRSLSATTRVSSQLGLDQGIWNSSSPLPLSLNPASASLSFELVSHPTPTPTRIASHSGTSTNTGSRRKKLVRMAHADSPKRIRHRSHLTEPQPGIPSNATSPRPPAPKAAAAVVEKKWLHRPVKKRRRSRLKGVAVMIARHQFTVVDEDDSLIARANAGAGAA